MFHLFRYAILLIALVGALALPLASEPLFDELETRAANLQISLRESKPRTKDWHFALVMHAPDALDGGRLAAHEFVIFEKCMVYDNTRRARTSEDQIKATAKLNPGRARSDAQLEAQITEFLRLKFKDAKVHPPSTEGFTNCFDFTIIAMRELQSAGFVDAAAVAPFLQYYASVKDEVREYTDAGTLAACSLSTRALNGKPNPACRGKATKGKATLPPASKGAAKPKAAPAPQKAPAAKAAPRPPQGKGAPPKGRK